jgi:glycosyltransferase involved in cell wall biosynthesis
VKTKSISVLFLTLNRLTKLQECFASLEWMHSCPDVLEWLILDNNSTEPGLRDWLSTYAYKHRKVKLFLSDTNKGVAGGRDFLLSQSSGTTILSLDSDVIDKRHSFMDCLYTMSEQPEIGIVGLHGAFIPPDWGWIHSTKSTYTGFCDAVTGYCQMFDRRVYELGCKFDQHYNPYWLEDTDFCMQIRYKLGLYAFVLGAGINGLIHEWGNTNAGAAMRRTVLWEYFKTKWQVIHDSTPKPEWYTRSLLRSVCQNQRRNFVIRARR